MEAIVRKVVVLPELAPDLLAELASVLTPELIQDLLAELVQDLLPKLASDLLAELAPSPPHQLIQPRCCAM